MREVRIQEAIQRDPDLLAAVKQATQILEGVATASKDQVEAEWTLEGDPNKDRVLGLKLSDWAGSVRRRFAPNELTQPDYLKGRLNWLWGDLLQVRNHQQLKRLRDLFNEAEGA